MTISAGTKLGPYEIAGAIRGGGMGEMYRARDARLDRLVAIMTLSDHVAERTDLRERFEREASTIASLNHPDPSNRKHHASKETRKSSRVNRT